MQSSMMLSRDFRHDAESSYSRPVQIPIHTCIVVSFRQWCTPPAQRHRVINANECQGSPTRGINPGFLTRAVIAALFFLSLHLRHDFFCAFGFVESLFVFLLHACIKLQRLQQRLPELIAVGQEVLLVQRPASDVGEAF